MTSIFFTNTTRQQNPAFANKVFGRSSNALLRVLTYRNLKGPLGASHDIKTDVVSLIFKIKKFLLYTVQPIDVSGGKSSCMTARSVPPEAYPVRSAGSPRLIPGPGQGWWGVRGGGGG